MNRKARTMLTWLLHLPLQDVTFLATVGTLAVAAIIALLVRKPTRRWLLTAGIAVVGGAGLGLLTAWIVGDVMDVFGVALTPAQMGWVALTFAAVALAVASLWRARWWRRIIAVAAVPVVIVTGCAFVNANVGYYSDLSDVLGMTQYKAGALDYQHGDPAGADVPLNLKNWTPPKDMPATGRVLSVDIPSTVSHFAARDAVVYLPPAAQVPNPPALPVIVALSGQPGSPSDWFTAGHLDQYLDAYAAAHKGIAPIVVVPDQLGDPGSNPMCVDSPLGNVATYITTDVVDWITGNLHVASSRTAWSLLGFSEGATCSSQFLASDSARFGSMLAISSEIGPTNGPSTVQEAFGGSAAAYAAAMPIAKMQAHGHYTDTLAVYAVGQNDTQYVSWDKQLVAAAQAAGIQTQFFVSPGTAHDWYTVAYGLAHGMPIILQHLGLD
jgi:S-formylglutathione hydrolase FrmB